jgi:hypothetical protein
VCVCEPIKKKANNLFSFFFFNFCYINEYVVIIYLGTRDSGLVSCFRGNFFLNLSAIYRCSEFFPVPRFLFSYIEVGYIIPNLGIKYGVDAYSYIKKL